MRSKWYEYKPEALKMRINGASFKDIQNSLGIPKSTLSGWLKNIKLTKEQQENLFQRWELGLIKARKQAVVWHNQQKQNRLKAAEEEANLVLVNINHRNKYIQELALAMLYLGEGGKTKNGTSLGSSDPLILKFFINFLLINDVNISKIKCALHLRADQNPEVLKEFWSKQLNISLNSFTSFSIDLRTKNRPTYAHYYGVCVVSCGNIALQRKLVFISRKFCEYVINKMGS